MKTVLEKVRKNKPCLTQQKAPKNRPVGGVGHDDGGHTAGSWKDRMPRLIQQLFSRKKERYPISSQISPDIIIRMTQRWQPAVCSMTI